MDFFWHLTVCQSVSHNARIVPFFRAATCSKQISKPIEINLKNLPFLELFESDKSLPQISKQRYVLFFEMCNMFYSILKFMRTKKGVPKNPQNKNMEKNYLMFGSSSPRPFFLSTPLRIMPSMNEATPRQANITRGHV